MIALTVAGSLNCFAMSSCIGASRSVPCAAGPETVDRLRPIEDCLALLRVCRQQPSRAAWTAGARCCRLFFSYQRFKRDPDFDGRVGLRLGKIRGIQSSSHP